MDKPLVIIDVFALTRFGYMLGPQSTHNSIQHALEAAKEMLELEGCSLVSMRTNLDGKVTVRVFGRRALTYMM